MVAVTIRTSTTRVRIVEPGETVLTVPYGPHGDPRGRFVDLRENAGRIDQIEGLHRRPALREQIMLLNRRDGPLMTFGCSSWTTRLFQQAGPPAWRTSSSVWLAFVGTARQDLRGYVALARAFLDTLDTSGRADRWNSVIELQPGRVVFLQRPGWCIHLRTSGYGLDTRAAMLQWDLCVRAQTDMFRSLGLVANPRSHQRFDIKSLSSQSGVLQHDITRRNGPTGEQVREKLTGLRFDPRAKALEQCADLRMPSRCRCGTRNWPSGS